MARVGKILAATAIVFAVFLMVGVLIYADRGLDTSGPVKEQTLP